MSMTIAALVAATAAELARHAPEIQKGVSDFLRDNRHTVIGAVKNTDWREVERSAKDTMKAASDFAHHRDDHGEWKKK